MSWRARGTMEMEGTRTATACRLAARPRAESPTRPRIAEACGLKRATEPASKLAARADAGTAARAPADATDAPARARVEAAPPRETARTAPMPVKGVTTEDIIIASGGGLTWSRAACSARLGGADEAGPVLRASSRARLAAASRRANDAATRSTGASLWEQARRCEVRPGRRVTARSDEGAKTHSLVEATRRALRGRRSPITAREMGNERTRAIDGSQTVVFLGSSQKNFGAAGYRSPHLPHAKRTLYHLSYYPFLFKSYGRTVWEETCFVFSPDYAAIR